MIRDDEMVGWCSPTLHAVVDRVAAYIMFRCIYKHISLIKCMEIGVTVKKSIMIRMEDEDGEGEDGYATRPSPDRVTRRNDHNRC